jgi:hypothetical protein
MKIEDLRRALERLESDDDDSGIARIVRSALEEGRSAAEAAVEVWLEGSPLSRRALSVVLALEDLAVAPLARSRIPAPPSDRSLRMRMLARAARAAQTRAVQALLVALDDVTDLGSRGGIGESQTPVRRVCDEAYLHLRDVLLADSTTIQAALNAEAFLNAPESERDAHIREAKTSRVFRRLVDDADVEL